MASRDETTPISGRGTTGLVMHGAAAKQNRQSLDVQIGEQQEEGTSGLFRGFTPVLDSGLRPRYQTR